MALNISRRDFLKTSSVAAAGVTAASLTTPVNAITEKKEKLDPSPLNKWPGRCVLNYNNLQNATPTGGESDDETIVKKMVDDAMKLLTGQLTVGEAWKSIFPDTLSQTSKVAIKVNIVNSMMPSHPFILRGIVEGLKQMEIGGSNFPGSNIYLYDANNNNSFNGAGYTSSLFSDVNMVKSNLSNHGDGAVNNSNYADTLYECDFLINIPGIRGHSCAERFTIGYKSHYGTYPTKYHDNTNIRGYLRDIVGTGPIYNKHVLTVVSALFGLKEGTGPSGSWGSSVYYTEYVKTKDSSSNDPRPNTIVVSTDPVTAEFQAIKIMKIRDGNSYDISDMPKYLQASAGIQGSLSTVLNFGIIDESEMAYGEIINGVIVDPVPINKTNVSMNRDKARLRIFHTPDKHSVFIEFEIPSSYKGKVAEVAIVNVRGVLIRRLYHKILGLRTRVVWDGKDTAGRRVASGKYVITAKIDELNLINSLSLGI